MAASRVFLGPVFDRASGTWATLSGSSLNTRNGPDRLSQECSAALWVSASLEHADTTLVATLSPLQAFDPYGAPASGDYPALDVVGVGPLNLSPLGRYRVFLAYDAPGNIPPVIPTRPRLAPDAIVTVTNMTGALGNIQDDPSAPGSTHYTLTADGGGILRVGFAAPSGTLRSGDAYQRARVLIRNNSSTTTHSLTEISLWENGSQLRLLHAATQLAPGVNRIFSGLWDAAEISNLADLEIHVEVNGKASEVDIRAIDVQLERSAGPVTFDPATVVDTGWVSPWTPASYVDVHPAETWLRDAMSCVYWRVDGNNDLAPLANVRQVVVEFDDQANEDGFLFSRFARCGVSFQGTIADSASLKVGTTTHPDGPIYRGAAFSTRVEDGDTVLRDLAQIQTSRTGFYASIAHDPTLALTLPFYARPRRNFGFLASSVPRGHGPNGTRYTAAIELEEAHERDWTVLGG